MRLSMMLTASYSLSLWFCQALEVFPVTIHLGRLFYWRHLSTWSAILVCKLLNFFIQYICTPLGSELFQFGTFLTYFLTFLISMRISSWTVSSSNSFLTFFNQSMSSLCITAWSHIYLQKCLLSSTSGITLSLCVPSNSLNNLFWFDSNKRFCMCCAVLMSYLSSFTPTATNLCLRKPVQQLSVLQWIFFQGLIRRFHFAISFVSFCLIVLTVCLMSSAFLKALHRKTVVLESLF